MEEHKNRFSFGDSDNESDDEDRKRPLEGNNVHDYGFFHQYLSYNTIDKYIPIETLEAENWTFKIGRMGGYIAGINGNDRNAEKEFYILMKTRVRRLQFLRSFDVECCLSRPPDIDHLKMDRVLEKVALAIDIEINSIP